MTRALVLSGGGNRGALQVGAAEVLLAEGLRFDLLVGTSVGAINASYLAADPSPGRARRLRAVWRDLRGETIFGGSRLGRLLSMVRRRTHLYDSGGLRALLEEHLPYENIEDAAVPLVVVATDLATGNEQRIDRGPVVEGVLASTALPGIFPPVAWDGDLLIDGGVAANVPLAAAAAAGATEAWVLDVTGPCSSARPPRHALDVVLQSMTLMSAARGLAELACPPGSIVVHHLALPCSADVWFSDFSATPALLVEGARLAREALVRESLTPPPTA